MNAEPIPARASVRALIEKEVVKTRLPADIAEAVAFVESRYDSPCSVSREPPPSWHSPRSASVTAYLTKAWRLAQGDLCKALMKYRAGHGEETMTARSVIYCNRARNRLIAMNSPCATPGAVAEVEPDPEPVKAAAPAKVRLSGEAPYLRRRTTLPEILSGVGSGFALLIKEKTNKLIHRGIRMLDAIRISLALWAMIVCGGIKAAQLAHYLF